MKMDILFINNFNLRLWYNYYLDCSQILSLVFILFLWCFLYFFFMSSLSLPSIPFEQGNSNQKKRKKKQQERYPNWIGFINNNYINSRTQTRPESGMNPFPPRHNSFWDNHKNVRRKSVILEGIMSGGKGFIPDSGRVWVLELI